MIPDMMKRLNVSIVTYCMTLLCLVGVMALGPSVASAETPKEQVCSTLDAANCGTPKNGIDLNQTISAVVNILSLVVGVVAVIMVIIGGFMYVISNGDSSKLTSARNTITYALVGIVIVAFAQAFVRFVLARIV
jgi:hypothetical protein